MNQKPKLARQYFFGISASLGGFILGSIIGWSSPAEEEISKYLLIDKLDYSLIASVMALGAAFSQILTFGLILMAGQKATIITLSMLSLLGWITLLLSNTYWLYLLGRFLQGLFAGGFCIAVPIFICEITHKSIRGTICVIFHWFLVTGIFYSYIISFKLGSAIYNLFAFVFPIILAALMSFARESPIYYCKKNNMEAAVKSMEFYHGKDNNNDSELTEIEDSLKKEDFTYCQLLKTKSARHAILILLIIHAVQQFSGFYAIIFHTRLILEMSNPYININYSIIIILFIQIPSTIVSVITIDKLGRKILWYISSSLMAVSIFILGLYFSSFEFIETFLNTYGLIPVVTACFYVAGYSMGCGPLPWVLLGEILPIKIKTGVATSVAFLNWIFAFLIIQTFPTIVHLFGINMLFYICGSVIVVSVGFVMIFVYETKNKSLCEIQTVL